MIDRQIQSLLDMVNEELEIYNIATRKRYYKPISGWKWKGHPGSSSSLGIMINNMIKEADEGECILSPSEYIRECKKYYERENQKGRMRQTS